ncbi:hypothetical protein ACTFIR_011747 [Dictyostelium discoideum]
MENNKKLTLCEIPNAFIQFFNNKDYENKSKLFNNTETDQWWVSGDKNVYPFAGSDSIQKRLDGFQTLQNGYDKYSMTLIDQIIDHDRRIMLVIGKTVSMGFGMTQEYSNEYAFIMSVNEDGKICSIKEYFDPSAYLKMAQSTPSLQGIFKNFFPDSFASTKE